MELAQLRAFLAVAEELHFGRAAERLHIAQPPLSRTIKHLERELDSRLFDRNTRSVSLTSSGQALISPAREVLEAVRRAGAAVQAADGGEVGLVRISFAGLSTNRLVAALAREVRSSRPGIQLELSSQNFAQPAMKRLMQDQTDVALGRWDHIPADVVTEVVMPDSLVIALPVTHPLATVKTVDFERLGSETFVSLPPHEGSVLTDRLRRLSQAHGFLADVVQIAPDTQTALALVSAEVGCLLTLGSVARNENDPHVAFLALNQSATEDLPDVDLRAAWRRNDTSPALRAVLDALLGLGQEALRPDSCHLTVDR